MENAVRATKAMCAACFEVLISNLKKENAEIPVERLFNDEPQVSSCCPLFVTWTIGADKDLRGCIGTFDQSSEIGSLLPRYALVSALNDTRFSPITLNEVQHLQVAVSLLTNFTPIQDPLGWEVGRHGIEIEFRMAGRNYSGTFLPEVASEQGWDQATTLVYLFKKAGYKPSNPNRPSEDIVREVRPNLKVKTYESSKLSMSYAEFLQYIRERTGN